MSILTNIGIFDYERKKMCDLYDSQAHIRGQAYNISWTKANDGINTLSFTIPYKVDGDKNFRWQYMRSEYLIRLNRGDKTEWFIASKPVKSKSNKEIVGNVTCKGFPSILKTKNIYQTFDDENGIGTIEYLIAQILAGTGWTLGFCETMYEDDGTTEMVRSLKSDGKKGALGLINEVCNLFKCYPSYDSDQMQVNIYSLNRHNKAIEVEVGRNADTLQITDDSDNIVTRLYVEGEYGDNGYVGIDDVNPTGLSYLFNFDYYREIGIFGESHEEALQTYIEDASEIKDQIMGNQGELNEYESQANELIGQCQVALYYTQTGFVHPKYTYGSPSEESAALKVNDEVVVLNTDGTFRYAKIVTTPQALIESGDYGIAKFVTKAAGSIGAKEVQIEAKEKEIANLERKIEATSKEDKKAEYQQEIDRLENEIQVIYEGGHISSSDTEAIQKLMQPYIPIGYDGNVDLTNRIIVPKQTFVDAGYTDFDGTYGTIFTSCFSAGTTDEYDYLYTENVVFTVTPIKADGTVLTRQQVEDYCYEIIEAARQSGSGILEVDDLGLIFHVYVIPNGQTLARAIQKENDWGQNLHEIQAQGDVIRANYDFFGMSNTIDPAGIFDDIPRTCNLYDQMTSVMKPNGTLYYIDYHQQIYVSLVADQLEIEATFASAMGNLLRDGYWQNNNYIPGQEQALYNDACEMSRQMGKPAISYSMQYRRTQDDTDMPIDDLDINDIAHVVDDDLDINENLYIRKIVIGIDHENEGSLEVNNNEVTLSGNDLGSILSRMTQLSDLIDQKNALYERAKAISAGGSIYTDRLNGQIDVLKIKLLSTISNWYTDDNGNIMFLAADGSSAMMLCGAGFMIANSKDDNNEWNWRTFGTGA